jgi:hypothetical protein
MILVIMTILKTLNAADITIMVLLITFINATLHKCLYLILQVKSFIS